MALSMKKWVFSRLDLILKFLYTKFIIKQPKSFAVTPPRKNCYPIMLFQSIAHIAVIFLLVFLLFIKHLLFFLDIELVEIINNLLKTKPLSCGYEPENMPDKDWLIDVPYYLEPKNPILLYKRK